LLEEPEFGLLGVFDNCVTAFAWIGCHGVSMYKHPEDEITWYSGTNPKDELRNSFHNYVIWLQGSMYVELCAQL
jgi:hypothetical protein